MAGHALPALPSLEPGPEGDVLEIGACRRKDGSVFPVEFTRRLVETSEGPVVVATARDLTERLKAEERQATILKYQERVARCSGTSELPAKAGMWWAAGRPAAHFLCARGGYRSRPP